MTWQLRRFFWILKSKRRFSRKFFTGSLSGPKIHKISRGDRRYQSRKQRLINFRFYWILHSLHRNLIFWKYPGASFLKQSIQNSFLWRQIWLKIYDVMLFWDYICESSYTSQDKNQIQPIKSDQSSDQSYPKRYSDWIDSFIITYNYNIFT